MPDDPAAPSPATPSSTHIDPAAAAAAASTAAITPAAADVVGPSPPSPAPAVQSPTPAATAPSPAPIVHVAAGAGAAAAPVFSAPVASTAHAYGPPPPIHHLAHAPAPYRPSTLPQQLKRLAYVVSIVIGGGAVLAGVWSAFLLPLLHATFSARAALLAPQRDRWRSIIDKLREIRGIPIYPKPSEDEVEELISVTLDAKDSALVRARTRESDRTEKTEKTERTEKTEDGRKEKTTPLSPAHSAKIEEEEVVKTSGPAQPLFGDVSPLTAALRDLASSLDATATTRTSLVSTLEGYTSGLHRELFISRGAYSNPWAGVPGANTTSRVGLGTLGANLASAGGSEASPLGLPAAKSEEWDNVRREVRAIKGLLLNRRNFSVPARTPTAA